MTALNFIPMDTRGGMFDCNDAETLWEGMVPDSAVVAWQLSTLGWSFVNALAAAGVEMAMNVRIPAPIVDEAFAALEA